MSDVYRLVTERRHEGQLGLGLEIKLDQPVPVGQLETGERFLFESGEIEGRLEALGTGSATVLLWRPGEKRPERTTWALTTPVRRLRW